jgi:hypothetical protein
MSPTAVANSGSRLFVQMLNPTIYFRKIKEKYKKILLAAS